MFFSKGNRVSMMLAALALIFVSTGTALADTTLLVCTTVSASAPIKIELNEANGTVSLSYIATSPDPDGPLAATFDANNITFVSRGGRHVIDRVTGGMTVDRNRTVNFKCEVGNKRF